MSTLKVERVHRLETDEGFEVSDVLDLFSNDSPASGAGKIPFNTNESYPANTVGAELNELEGQIEDIQFDHIGEGGIEQHPVATEVAAGFMPPMPPNDGKTYAFKDGQLIEFVGASPLLGIEWFPGYRSALATERPGCVPLDGQIAERAVFPSAWGKLSPGTLYPVIDDPIWLGSVAARRNFSSGDGSTTFRLMDLNGATTGKAYFLRGSKVDSFSLKEDMIQNITGVLQGATTGALPPVSGAFAQSGQSAALYQAGNGYSAAGVTFDASRVVRTGTETAPAHAEGVWIIRLANAQPDIGTVDVNALASEVATLKTRNGALIKETYYRTPGAISHTFALNTAVYEVEAWSGGAGGGQGGGSSGGSTTFGSIVVSGGTYNGVNNGRGAAPGLATGGLLNLNGNIAGSVDSGGYGSTGASAPRGGSGGGVVTEPDGKQPGGGGGSTANISNSMGSSGGYSFDRKTITTSGMTIAGTVGVGGNPGTGGGKGGDGMIIIREYASSGPSIESIAVISAQLQNSIGIGNGQSYQNVTASRVSGSTYTNNTGRTIFVSITGGYFANNSGSVSILVNGDPVITLASNNAGTANTAACAPVPNGATYRVDATTVSILKWMEYR